jgi:hypothetical protein
MQVTIKYQQPKQKHIHKIINHAQLLLDNYTQSEDEQRKAFFKLRYEAMKDLLLMEFAVQIEPKLD